MTAAWTADAILTPDGLVPDGCVVTSGPCIAYAGPLEGAGALPANVHRLDGCTLAPGFIDTHIHGAAGADTMDATPEALDAIGRHLTRHGVTAWTPTTITAPIDNIRAALDNVRRAMERPADGRPQVVGAHLEGPYINVKMKGAQPAEHVRAIDVPECLELCGDVVVTVTLAPEMPNGLELAAALSEAGIRASAGHTDATYATMQEAHARGLCAVTHGFNAQRGLHHREPGVIGMAMATPAMQVELIADLVHVHPGAIAVLWHAKGEEGILLVSDGMRGAGMPDGDYDLGGQMVRIGGGRCLLPDGTLAGSITNLGDEVRNVATAAGVPLRAAVRMASENPARALGLYPRKGALAAGSDADFVALGPALNVALTVAGGVEAYRAPQGAAPA